ncbi:S26 family signal peptidase [Hoeflea poritis]|uniref:Signal peptidase I n=1 Tax=Hoeflea poritis TaxID=2993659 RepID=A0ABT4VY22_9HYPH|nr:S26 family signal peptidase [Hoeflea poritis]MDA4848888.1 S26 family signal peptidase [Hoeflea poritis]
MTLIAVVLSSLAMVVSSSVDLPVRLIWNGSESAPVGLYRIDDQAPEIGDYVLVRLPDSIQDLVADRAYLPPDIPLIKRVVAAEGDTVCRQDREIVIDSVIVALARMEDRIGRSMPAWSGCYVLDERQLFLLQNHSGSLDSRYFGPVDRRLIIGRATRLRLPWQDNREN